MNHMKRILLSFFLIFAVSFGSPAALPGIQDNPVVATAEAKKHCNSQHKKKAKIVYITRTGECYHTHKCGNGTYYKSTLKKAKSYGLRPCKKCY